jgi:hypothetical protein
MNKDSLEKIAIPGRQYKKICESLIASCMVRYSAPDLAPGLVI